MTTIVERFQDWPHVKVNGTTKIITVVTDCIVNCDKILSFSTYPSPEVEATLFI